MKEHEPSPLKESDVVCLGRLRRVLPPLAPLHAVGCGRDKAANRELFFPSSSSR